jgi:hypothetical protein
MWWVINLVLNVWLLGSLLLGCSDLRLLGNLLLGRFILRPCRRCSDHLLLALITESLNKGLQSVSGGGGEVACKQKQ